MDRIELLNHIISKNKVKTYLEIGVFYGKCFLNIKCKRKIAVDPDFRIPWDLRKDTLLKKIKRRFFNTFSVYYKLTSDDFFKTNPTILDKYSPQLIFIDGLHTYEQTIKDVKNSLKYLQDDGIIVLHDCNPITELQALPASSYEEVIKLNLPNWDGVWNGDVWKTIANLRASQLDIDVFVIDTDCGLGIVRKRKNTNPLNASLEQIEKWSYAELEQNREQILNLKKIDSIKDLF